MGVNNIMDNSLYLKKNLNNTHRVIRIVIGVVLITWAITFASPGWIAIVSAIGGTQIIEGIIGY